MNVAAWVLVAYIILSLIIGVAQVAFSADKTKNYGSAVVGFVFTLALHLGLIALVFAAANG